MSAKKKLGWEEISLKRCGQAGEAGLWITSLPWPRQKAAEIGLGGRSASCQALGHWPGSDGFPRRLLLMADADNQAPESLSLSQASPSPASASPEFTASMEAFAAEEKPTLHCEHHRLVLRHGDRSLGLTMGLKTGGEVHWWEACRLVVLDQSPECLTVEMGGAIEVEHMSEEVLKGHQGVTNPFLHRHNWLNGRLFVRVHRNGVCEVFAHHINSKFFDGGRPLLDVVPVIGFTADVPTEELDACTGPWDGSVPELRLGGIRLDLTEPARLATAKQPGEMSRKDNTLVWQPYLGVELYGGDGPEELTGDPFIFHGEDKCFPQGMARTLRFSLSLSNRSPRVLRYLAPVSWYEQCGEYIFGTEQLDAGDQSWELARQWTKDHVFQGGFEDGSLPRHLRTSRSLEGQLRHEPGWEGELPYAQFLTAWRTGDPEDYAVALRSAYYFTDVVVDHAEKLARMHASAPPAVALPMNRLQGTIAAYLETGDPYLLETAEAVTSNSHWLHKNSWPRLAVGRDACFLRSAVMLYRYFGDDFFQRIAREGVDNVVASQRENGSFGDQGGGSGIHQWGAYITKPWMGTLALNSVLDYLELFPDETELKHCVKRFADWLMSERQVREGVLTWCFQHDYNGERRYFHPGLGKYLELPSVNNSWHHETLARVMGYVSREWKDPSYWEAWSESHKAADPCSNDHSVAAALQFLRPPGEWS